MPQTITSSIFSFGIFMKASKLFFLLVTLINRAHAEVPESLSGKWTLQIKNLQHEDITTLSIQFSELQARSCLGGNWRQVVVGHRKTPDSPFFPADEPLSYKLDGNKLSIGRNEVCDAYLQLSGELIKSSVSGEYVEFGWGSKQLGYFYLKRDSR